MLAQALENRELAELLDAPQVPMASKQEVLNNALADAVGPLAINLMSLLASRNLSGLVPDVVDQYQLLLDAHRGIEQAEVVSAVPLADEERRRVEALLREMVGKEIRLTSRVDPGILGGLVARVGDRVIDGSTATRLRDLRRDLVEQR